MYLENPNNKRHRYSVEMKYRVGENLVQINKNKIRVNFLFYETSPTTPGAKFLNKM